MSMRQAVAGKMADNNNVCRYICYVSIAVSLKNNAIDSNSTLKCEFRAGSGSEFQFPFQPLTGNITYCTFNLYDPAHFQLSENTAYCCQDIYVMFP